MKLFFLFCFVTGQILSAASLSDFSATGDFLVNLGKVRGQSLDEAAIQGKRHLRLNWQAGRFSYAEVNFKRPLLLPKFDSGTIELRFCMPMKSAVKALRLRLIDRENEVFQIHSSHDIPAGNGWKSAEFRVESSGKPESWGTRANGKFDWPVRVLGVAVLFSSRKEGGQLIFGDLAWHDGGSRKLSAQIPLPGFNGMGKFLYTAKDGEVNLKNSGSGIHIRGDARQTVVYERRWLENEHPVPLAIQLQCEAKSGSGRLFFRIRGSDGKIQQGSARFAPGRQTVRMEFAPFRCPRGKLVDLSIVPDKGCAAFDIELQAAHLEFLASSAEAVELELETGSPFRVLPEKNQGFRLRFQNRSRENICAEAKVRLEDFFGGSVTRNFSIALLPNQTQHIAWDQPLSRYGIYYLHCTLKFPDGTGTGFRKSLAVIPARTYPPRRPGDFIFGVISHPERWAEREQQLEADAAARCGVEVLRTDTGWERIQPQPGVWNFQHFDHIVKIWSAAGIELMPILSYCTRWAAPAEKQNTGSRDDWNRAMPDLNAWATFVRTIVKRYRGTIRCWEVWNEPDLYTFAKFDAAEYIKLLKTSYSAAHEADPDCVILTGGFATLGGHAGKKEGFHETVLREAAGNFDIHAYHEHGGFQQYRMLVESKLLPMRRAAGTKVPWYANETAIDSAGGRERIQAVTLFKKLIFSWSAGAIGYNWYDLRNDGFGVYNGEHNFGMLTNDFQPKAVYPVYAHLASDFRQARLLKSIEQHGVAGWLFSSPEGLLLPAWHDVTGTEIPQTITTDADAAFLIDLMGNRTPLPLVDGFLIRPVTDLPSTLLLKEAKQAKVLPAFARFTRPGVILPGRATELELHLAPLPGKKQNIHFRVELPHGMKCEQSHFIRESDGKPEIRILKLTGFPTSPGNTGVRLHYTVGKPEKLFSGTVDCPLKTAKLLTKQWKHPEADFVLNRPEQVVQLHAADPGRQHLNWQGPQDLSAEIRLGLTADNLLLEVRVTDNRHYQPFHGSSIWQGDSVQFALQFPTQSGSWEIGFSRSAAGAEECAIWSTPSGFSAGETAKRIKVHSKRQASTTIYNAEIPLDSIGITSRDAGYGFQFNLLVNDNDGDGRKGWIQIAPGLGAGKTTEAYPVLVF